MPNPRGPRRPGESLSHPDRSVPGEGPRGRSAALSRFRQAAALDPPLDQLIGEGLDLVRHALQVDGCLYATRAPGATDFLVQATRGLPDLVRQVTLGGGPHSLAGHAQQTGDSVLVDDLGQVPEPGLEPFLVATGARSALVAPVRGQRGAAGVLGAFAQRSHHFAPDDPAFLHRVAGILAAALYRMDWRQRGGQDRR